MKRVVNKAKNFKEAEEWDVQQYLNMTLEERWAVAKELKRRSLLIRSFDLPDSLKTPSGEIYLTLKISNYLSFRRFCE